MKQVTIALKNQEIWGKLRLRIQISTQKFKINFSKWFNSSDENMTNFIENKRNWDRVIRLGDMSHLSNCNR